MARFISKPTEVDASQFTGEPHPHVQFADGWYVVGKQGPVQCREGDWIIAEPDGSGHYPCADAIFRAKYEPVA